MDPRNPELFVLAFVGLWIGVGLLVAYLGGWATLAKVYRHSDEFRGERRRFQSARMRWGINYGSCLTVGATPRGLYLAALFIFRIGHPPLFMPWTDISIGEQRG
jgi:hypothetical protein